MTGTLGPTNKITDGQGTAPVLPAPLGMRQQVVDSFLAPRQAKTRRWSFPGHLDAVGISIKVPRAEVRILWDDCSFDNHRLTTETLSTNSDKGGQAWAKATDFVDLSGNYLRSGRRGRGFCLSEMR
jgi:hypothetical protein